MAIERVQRKNSVDEKIVSIEKSLNEMLQKLNDELEKVVESGKVDKARLESILSEIDKRIINDTTVQDYILSDDKNVRKKVNDLIKDAQDAVRETIDMFKDETQEKTLTEDASKKVESIFEDKVMRSETVRRTKTLEEFRSQEDSISLTSTKGRIEDIDKKLREITNKLNKMTIIENQMREGETFEVAAQRLAKDANEMKMDENPIKGIKTVTGNTYDYGTVAAEIGTDNYSYKNPENIQKVAEFLTQLYKLKEGNPEIALIFEELEKDEIKPDKDGNFKLKFGKKANSKINRLRDHLNKKVKENPIDFDKAKTNTVNAFLDRVDNDIKAVLDLGIMKLYPAEMKKWQDALKEDNPQAKINVWKEMNAFLQEHDFQKDVEGIDSSKKEELTTSKKALEDKKARLTFREDSEKYEHVDGKLNSISVMGIELESDVDLAAISDKDLKKAIAKLYSEKKSEFEYKFDREAPDKLKKVGIFERIGYAISHGTLTPKKDILEKRMATWAKQQISVAIIDEVRETARLAGERDAAYKFGALTPEQLQDVRKKQQEVLEKHKKAQERAIIEGSTKTADEAATRAKDDAETEIGD